MPLIHNVHIRFYGDLGIFLEPSRRGRYFVHQIKGCPAVKDTLEALGVPHVAIDAILINGCSRNFSCQLKEGDQVLVYPPLYRRRIRGAIHLARLPRKIRFVIDSHLGKLVRHLRLLGFDAVYKNVFPDREIADIAARQRRIVLTRDKGLLKYRCLKWGYWVRSPDPAQQVREVIRRYDLWKHIRPFSLCVECGGQISRVAKKDIINQLPPKTRLCYNKFFRCRRCRHVYWRGSHYAKLILFIQRLKKRRERAQ